MGTMWQELIINWYIYFTLYYRCLDVLPQLCAVFGVTMVSICDWYTNHMPNDTILKGHGTSM